MGMLEPVVLIPHLNEIRMLSIRSIRHTKRLSAKSSLYLVRIKTAKNNLQTLAKDDMYNDKIIHSAFGKP